MRKLLAFPSIERYLPEIAALLPQWEIISAPPAKAVADHLRDAEITLGFRYPFTGENLSIAKSLRWIQLTHAGVDSLPLSLLAERGILLTTASGVHAYPIAESLWGMMLASARALFPLYKKQMERHWRPDGLDFSEMHGKTLGLLGAGAIGQEVARIGKAFGMQTLGFRHRKEPAPFVDSIYGSEGLLDMLRACDYIVNTLPLTPQTKGIIGREAIAAMKPGARYFSAGRGGTTDQDALVDALRDGRLAFAGLDVVTPEPLPADSPLWSMENVFIGGHTSGQTDRYDERVMEIFLTNLRAYAETGEPCRNVVRYDEGY